MDSLIQYFTSNIGTDKVWTAFLALAIYYIVNKEPFKIFTHFAERRDKEHELAMTLMGSEKLSKEANGFLREYLERTAFQRYYGIHADNIMRNALLEFHRKHQQEIGWRELRRAYPNIRLDGTKLSAKLTWVDHGFRWAVTTMCVLVGTYAIFVIGYAVFAVGATNKGLFFSLTLAALALLIATMYFSSLNWPYHNTRKIIKLLTNCAK